MAKVTWHPKKEEREITFLYHLFFYDDNRRRREISVPNIEEQANRLELFISDVVADINEREERRLLAKELDNIGISPYQEEFEEENTVKKLMLDMFNEHCLGTKNFDWIDPDNERLCNFVWSYLRVATKGRRDGILRCNQSLIIDDKNKLMVDVLPSLGLNESVYFDLKLPVHLTNSREKRECIIYFFDLWMVSRQDKERQLQYFVNVWGEIKNKSKMEDWLIKNEGVAEWAWNYTFKTYLAFTAPAWLDLSGVNKNDKAKQAMITLYDLLSIDHRTILMASIRKSGTVQKNRINSENRKSMSIPLSEERKEMLKRIAKDSNRRIYQVVEDMIDQEYQRQYSH